MSDTGKNTSVVSDPSMEKEDGVLWSNVEGIQHTYAVHEYERQVFGRINARDFSAWHLLSYQMEEEDKKEMDEELKKAVSQFTPIKNCIKWQTVGKKSNKKKQQEQAVDGLHTIECDLYMRLTGMDDDGTVSCMEILKDLTDDIHLINKDAKGLQENTDGTWDVKLENDSMLWMEVAETPQSLRYKLVQLERAVRFFKKAPGDKNAPGAKQLPAVAIICLNGEPGLFKIAVEHFKTLYKNNLLTKWVIFKEKIPVFVTFTPFRNVYGTLQEIKTSMVTKTDLAELKYLMAASMVLTTTTVAAILASQILKK